MTPADVEYEVNMRAHETKLEHGDTCFRNTGLTFRLQLLNKLIYFLRIKKIELDQALRGSCVR